MTQLKIYKTIDLTGNTCSGPLGELSGVMDEVKEGEAVEAIISPENLEVVKSFCSLRDWKIVEEKNNGKNYILLITLAK
ncbi:sulfurtransferase TusA family protein [Acidianus brierleyi]|uniref:Response regulator SirA n=1 Tax=Acidianus brierleyi TaxID=41673 RepID=A0A2U9IDZ0_9CREN|nr:sulfurtransferase TusA family protein [Acidianus brierleyi]AWR94242.1 response regulator SirA [Acidianus brierleyi]